MNIMPTVEVTPSIELHPHQEIHLNADKAVGCCGCFSACSRKDRRDKSLAKEADTTSSLEQRMRAAQQLASLLGSESKCDPIADNHFFEDIRARLNEDLDEIDAIDPEVLAKIVRVFSDVKRELDEKKTHVSHRPAPIYD